MTSSIYQPLLNLKIPGIYNLTISKDEYRKIIPFIKFETTNMKDFIKDFDKYLYGKINYSGYINSNNPSYKDYLSIFSKSSSYFERGISGYYENGNFSSNSFISYLDYMFNRDNYLLLSDNTINFNSFYFEDYLKAINLNSSIYFRNLKNANKIKFEFNKIPKNYFDYITLLDNLNNYNIFSSKINIIKHSTNSFEEYQYIFNPKIIEKNPYIYNIEKYNNNLIQDSYPRVYSTYEYSDYIKSIEYIEDNNSKKTIEIKENINFKNNRFEIFIKDIENINNRTSVQKPLNNKIIITDRFESYLKEYKYYNFTISRFITLANLKPTKIIQDKYTTFNFYLKNFNKLRFAKLEISKKEISIFEQNNIFENSFIEYSKYNKYYKELKLKINIKKFTTNKFQDIIKTIKRNYNINSLNPLELKYKIIFTGLNYNNKISKSFFHFYKSFDDALTKLKGEYTSIKLQNEYGRFELFINTLNPLEKNTRTWYLDLSKYQIAKKEITIKELSKLEQNTFSYKDFVKDFDLFKSKNNFEDVADNNLIEFRSKRYEHYIKYLFSINSFNSVDSAAIYEKVT